MGVLSRLSNIFTANIHALIDRAENVEILLDHALREMEEALAGARRSTAGAIAIERRLGREADHHRALADHWKDRARQALANSDEPLARRALGLWHEHDASANSLAEQHAEAAEAATSARAALRSLETRLSETRRREQMLVSRHRLAKVRVEAHRHVGAGEFGLDAAHSRFRGLEERLIRDTDEWIAEAELHDVAGIDAEFAGRERRQAIDRELESLTRERVPLGEA